MSQILDFSCKVTEKVTGVPFDLVRDAYTDSEVFTTHENNALQPYGIDPATIIALITAIIQVIELMRNNCNKPQLFSENARVRNPIMLAIFRARVRAASQKVGYTKSSSQLADAMLDVAHSSGERVVAEVVDELRMI